MSTCLLWSLGGQLLRDDLAAAEALAVARSVAADRAEPVLLASPDRLVKVQPDGSTSTQGEVIPAEATS